MTPARDQGSAGTCASFGVTSNLEFIHGKRDLSEACMTHEAEKRHGDCAEGLATVHGYLAGKNPGIVDESVWGYDENQICWSSPPNTSGSPRYRFNNIKRVFYRPTLLVLQNMSAIAKQDGSEPLAIPTNFVRLAKAALVTHRVPLTISVPVWWASDGHFSAGWEWGPDINMPTPANILSWLAENGIDPSQDISVDDMSFSPPNVSGWHAISICGFDDTKGRFEFKNSWSPWWGNSGFGTIPYKYITMFSRDAYAGY